MHEDPSRRVATALDLLRPSGPGLRTDTSGFLWLACVLKPADTQFVLLCPGKVSSQPVTTRFNPPVFSRLRGSSSSLSFGRHFATCRASVVARPLLALTQAPSVPQQDWRFLYQPRDCFVDGCSRPHDSL
jgi:hypothetical protein